MEDETDNKKTGEKLDAGLKGGGVGVSALPFTFEVNLAPKPMGIKASRPIDFTDLEGCLVNMASIGFSPFINPFVHKFSSIAPTESHTIITVLKVTSFKPEVLFNFKLTDKTNLGRFRISSPNGGASEVAGKLEMVRLPLRPMFPVFPTIPTGPLPPPTPPVPPKPPVRPVKPPAPPKPPRRFDISADVAFDFDTAKLKQDAYSQLFEIMTELNSGPWSRVRIEGHADSTGSVAYNKDLSLARAYAVRDWLGQQGAKNARGFEVFGHSELKPKASNATAAGRALNRRVEVSLFQ